jgi:acetolactate synthase I/II/III large subunit
VDAKQQMKVSDYVVDFLRDRGIEDIFTVSGGGIMHLVDSLGRRPGVRYICNYHEQACAIAAESYARVRDAVGACIVTTGPGSTNALSGIAGAFVDSVPVIVISGQVRRDIIADYTKLRQLGPQEINIDGMAKPVVKYFRTLMDPTRVRYELEAAWWHATSGRPGPAWINIPLDVQGAELDEKTLVGFDAPLDKPAVDLERKISESIEMFSQAKRPVIIGGNGIHLSAAEPLFVEFTEKLGAPVLLTVGGVDLIPEHHPLNMGRFGPLGQRRANFTVQNSDLVLTIGASMSISSIGFNTAGFAPKAKRIMVNVDEHDLAKVNYAADLAIPADAGDFMREFLAQIGQRPVDPRASWWDACRLWKSRYPTITPDYEGDPNHVNSYYFSRVLSEFLPAGGVVVTGNSLDFWSVFQSFEVKAGQRVFTNINYGSMGWDLPAAVGAAVGRPGQMVCLPTGDGSIQFNIQELLTIRMNQLPVKIFVLNNDGYESIRATQRNFFDGRFVGSDRGSGIGNPDYRHVAQAYGIAYEHIARNDELSAKIPRVLNSPGPVLCELNLSSEQPRSPKSMSIRKPDGGFETRPLEDMFPFLPPDEVYANMHMFDDPA